MHKQPISQFLLPLFILTCLGLAACGHQTDETGKIRAATGNGNNNGNNNGNSNDKPIFDVAPGFEVSQLQVGQWIEWKGTSLETGVSQCVRWIITGASEEGVTLEGRLSPTCRTPTDALIESIGFYPNTGVVYLDQLSTGQPPKDPKRSIFPFIYGNKRKVTFKLRTLNLEKNNYQAFQLDKQPQVYLNRPKAPFHAFVMAWTEVIDKEKWTYTYNQSHPPIEPMPTNPSHP